MRRVTTQQQHPQACPRHADLASRIRNGTATSAAAGSIQEICHREFSETPANAVSAKYAHVADCTASAASAALPLRRAPRRFSVASTGMAIRAASVIAMPLNEASGRKPRTSEATAIPATATASRYSSTAAARPALRSEMCIAGINCRSTTDADASSMRLSEPNASIAGLRAALAAYRATPHSTSIHANVMLCSQMTVECDDTGRAVDRGFAPI
jgi:hypothetical protein